MTTNDWNGKMYNPTKSVDEILGLSDEDYTIYVGNLLKEEDALYKVDELDDELLKTVDKRPVDVGRICRINSTVFAKLDQDEMRTLLLAYNFNTRMIAAICQNNISESKSIFLDGIAFCRENKQYEAGKSLSQNVFRLFASGQIPHDEAPYFLTQITEFYKALEKHKDTIEALCAAASYFADASAFQSAYRAIHDAQQIALAHKMLHSQIRILETQGMVALIEGDLSCAEGEFQKCFKLYEKIKEAPPFELKANAALVKLRNEDYAGARDIYQTLINDPEAKHIDQIRQLRINLLVCYRELKDSTAIEDLTSRIESDLLENDLEARLEARLILAKTYFSTDKLSRGTAHLKEACIEIQLQIDQHQRLHYRRGTRERYVSRIKSILNSIGASGTADDVLHALVLCSSNSLLDWFSVLGWIDVVLQSVEVPNPIKEDLKTKKEDLIRFGTPFMYGFREKYDDPFEFANGNIADELGEQVARQADYSRPWREFNDLTSRIHQTYAFPSPYEGVTVQYGVEMLTRRLSSGSAFLFSFACEKACVLVFVAGGQYFRSTIPSDSLWQFFKALFDYQREGNANREPFRAQLTKLQASLEPTMAKIVDVLESSPISELVFIPDHLTEGFPILPAILASDVLRSRIKAFGLVFRTCPALKEESADSLVTGPGLYISNSEEHLELAEAEKALVKKTLAGQDYFEIDLQSEGVDFSKSPANSAKLLHLATHSIPANVFTDPWFVSTSTDSTKKGIWLESVQREAHKLQFTLVVLNGCNTGSTSNWNYFKRFSTNEKVGLSSVFLLNRQSIVVATQWNEPEIVGYIFSSLFYKRLASQTKANQAFILALTDMYELTKESTIELLEEISDEKVRLKRCEAVKGSQIDFPFRNAYCLGMFQCHSLLVRQ